MRLVLRLSSVLVLALTWIASASAPTWAAPKAKPATADGNKKSGKEISTDDKALDKQMDWETKVLGPNTQKKIDLAKIQKLQAEELARREKQDRIDQADKDRKERESAAAAAAQRNVKAPNTRDVPAVVEAPAKPAEKHDDAFVDKVMTGKAEKKKATVSNDEVDQLLNKAKQEKGASIVPSKGGRGGKGDTVDQLIATADKQAAIKTTTRKPNDSGEPVSAEAAARAAAYKAVAAALAAKADEEKARGRRPAVPDAAMLRAQGGAQTVGRQQVTQTSKPTAPRGGGWTDPFASDGASSSARGRGKVVTDTIPPPSQASGRHPPSSRPTGPNEGGGWKDPFEPGGGTAKPRPSAPKAAPAAKPAKHPRTGKIRSPSRPSRARSWSLCGAECYTLFVHPSHFATCRADLGELQDRQRLIVSCI